MLREVRSICGAGRGGVQKFQASEKFDFERDTFKPFSREECLEAVGVGAVKPIDCGMIANIGAPS
jgi:hypothetical protein